MSHKKNQQSPSIDRTELSLETIQKKFESIMPEVRRQVAVYEERERNGTLTPPPNNNPLFAY